MLRKLLRKQLYGLGGLHVFVFSWINQQAEHLARELILKTIVVFMARHAHGLDKFAGVLVKPRRIFVVKLMVEKNFVCQLM